ncbi:thiamine diphosphokinase [Halanaerobium salsuginis]|jgi:thiamine pyrophosphokinase|uniref:Thiamine diphosphokinase n=1 Tax=Halanaerobium salsuginis TaxID=29563 RepID=A0A1I4GHG9_9FIRM|nr:thiamine diphosphokinase [Halanaerobium salsuginis]SFL29478.1 thiamine diphosphokinase [Halanaerobium salsuginis]
MSAKKGLLILNGQLNFQQAELKKLIEVEKIRSIIAVDGGSNRLREVGLMPDLIIGDLDSITQENYNFYQSKGVKFNQHPVEKDQTDSELAVDFCLNNNFTELIIIAALGGRIDQQLANLNLLEYISEEGLTAKIMDKNLEIALLTNSKTFSNQVNKRLSLIPQTKVVKGVTILGCKYPLDTVDLLRSKTRGISNLITEQQAVIKLESGLLLYILEEL